MKKFEKVIKAPAGEKYLGSFLSDLPDNVMLNKVITGCGMTSVALDNSVKYVIAVPFVSLIINKEVYCKQNGIKICSVHGNGASHDDILAFKGSKIMTTYDSLPKVVKALEQRGDIKQWKILVDEAHKLIDQGAFRGPAIQNVLDNFKKFGSFVFGTATPVEDKYQLPELKPISKIRIDWGKLQEVKVNFCPYRKGLNQVMAVLALEYLNGTRKGNAHIFLNSVQSITSIIRYMKKGGYDVPDDIRIVCADNNRNFGVINSTLGSKYGIDSVNSTPKKINFYTATAFEGCDIYDKNGKIFVATDGSKDYTKIDILTILPQIIGRIRNSVYLGSIELLYTKNDFINTTTELEFEHKVKMEIGKARETVKEYHKASANTKRLIRDAAAKDSHLIVDGNTIRTNKLYWHNQMHSFRTLRKTYYVSPDGTEAGIEESIMEHNGVDYNYSKVSRIEIKGLNKVLIGGKPSFSDVCKDYVEKMQKGGHSFELHIIRQRWPLIAEAFSRLGPEKLKALEFRKKDIQKELTIRSITSSQEQKIVSLLDLKVGKWYSRKFLKESLQDIYDQLGIQKKATATHIEQWYGTKGVSKRVNGEPDNGFEIQFLLVKEAA